MARVFPIASRSEVHETLQLLFARDGVLPACIWDNAKEMVQGRFYLKLKDAACHLKKLETHTPWSNAAVREIKELEKRVRCKLLRSRPSKCLWDDCLYFVQYCP